LDAVTPDDVQRIAQTYLQPQKRVMGTYLPTGNTIPHETNFSEAEVSK
jgi:predicted Zn-dependent peptidase